MNRPLVVVVILLGGGPMMLGAYLAHRVIVAAYSSQGPERASKARAESERNLRGALIILAVACTAAIVYVLVA